MINISLNVTRVKDELKNVALGAAVLAPVVGVWYLLAILVDNGYLNKETLVNGLMGLFIIAGCWTIGGAVNALHKFYKSEKESKTRQAFERLGNGNT